ncbi:unnamed protein product [Parascedosporium putredinis]|uniref:F-box domain-containing protein n=1 Tax=Parascedosporium putredinis TaxID=1442378 RepID=A0A9P1H772_9PEZI|nr:unnamed protein product [Parascedosporium putredinis]CAI8000996.1 unnamed protein product [Parascedosporium putredinis]
MVSRQTTPSPPPYPSPLSIMPSAVDQPSRDNCDRRRRQHPSSSRLSNVAPELVGKAVTPFLRDHIPTALGKSQHLQTSSSMEVSLDQSKTTKFCYRHQPDAKCRKVADETKMAMIQRELDTLPSSDREAISNFWSLFSASPSKHRNLMLQGIITQCCFPQLSTVAREVHEQLKIDFLTALPPEISFKILCYLDTASLCKAAQVSRRWRGLADDDVVWHRMCKQHIDRKCTACGWGLPLLERKRLRDWTRQRTLANSIRTTIETEDSADHADRPAKRQRVDDSSEGSSSTAVVETQPKFRPFKDVYRDRFKIGWNWKYGRCAIKTFTGHTNGILCLQFDDNILATGSYDSTIKIWNIATGEELRTLRGHTGAVRALQFDDNKLISGSFDNTIKIWNWQTGECVNTLQCHSAGVISVHFEGKWLASGSIDRTVKVFNFETRQTWSFRGHEDWVNEVRMDLPSRTVFSVSDDCTIKMWDMDSKQCIRTYTGHLGQVQQLVLLPDDFEPDEESGEADNAPSAPPRYMLSAGHDNNIRLWEIATGRCIRTMFGHLEGIWGLAGDTLRFVSGANDSSIKIWDARSGKCERTFTGHAGPVTCVGLSDSRMASASEDGEIRIYIFEGNASNLEEYGTPA